MVMSCVAEAKATITASRANCGNWVSGSVSAMAAKPIMMTAWANSIQLRRCPSHAVSPGRRTRSTTGAHSTLIE